MIICPKCQTPLKKGSEIVETGITTVYRVVRDSEYGFTFIKERAQQTEHLSLVLCCDACGTESALSSDALEACEILTHEGNE